MSNEERKRKRERSPIFGNALEGENIFQRALIRTSSFLTRARPREWVRRMQLVLLGVTVIIVTFSLSYPSFTESDIDPDSPAWKKGQPAPQDVVAATSVEFLREKELQQARERAAKNASPHFTRDFSALSEPGDSNASQEANFRTMLKSDMDSVNDCRARPGAAANARCVRSKVPRWRRLTDDEIYNITSMGGRELSQKLSELVSRLFERFVILNDLDPAVRDYSGENPAKVRNLGGSSSREVKEVAWANVMGRNRIFNGDVRNRFEAEALTLFPERSSLHRRALVKLAQRYLYPLDAVRYDPDATERAREEARQNVQVSDYVTKYNRGQAIVKRDQVITEDIHAALSLHKQGRTWERFWRVVAIFLQQCVVMGLLLYFAMQFAHGQISAVSSNLIVFLTVWLFAVLLLVFEMIWATNATHNEVTHFFGAWVPLGIFVVMLAIIFGEVFTIPVGLYMAFLVFISSRYDGLSLLITSTMAVTATILGARIKKRVQFITTAMWLAALNFFLVTAGYLYGNRPILAELDSANTLFSSNYAEAVTIAVLVGLATFFVMVLLPVYEALFNIPTRFRLQELADPSHPLLQEMFKLAPSTWTHTLMVAAMVEKACERLNLNTVLARTGIYFHDIGKMRNAGFFIENQHLIPRPENVDKDSPQLAAKVIIDHVLDGIKMAEAYRLPREVIAFIPEHHGTSTMAFFYHKALEKMKRKVRREDFRYPGPIPQSKETGIAMIADSVEAASRSLEEVTEESLDGLIQKITNIKLAENQLDESGLTVGDLHVVKEAFVDVLISSFHSRPKYPNQADTKKLEEEQSQKKRGGKKAAAKGKASSRKAAPAAKKTSKKAKKKAANT